MKKHMFQLIILMLIITVISCCLVDPQKGAENNTTQPLGIVNASVSYNVSEAEIEKTSEITFKVGDKLVYQSPKYEQKDGSQDIFTVEAIEKIDGRDVYVVIHQNTEVYPETLSWVPKHLYTADNSTYYYDKEKGKLLRVVYENGEVAKEGSENLIATDSTFFAYWMLGLTDNKKWEILFTQADSSSNITDHIKLKFQVMGREKITNRECFKVEKKVINIDKNQEEETDYFWVDVKERILVKKEFYSENQKYFEENLISET